MIKWHDEKSLMIAPKPFWLLCCVCIVTCDKVQTVKHGKWKHGRRISFRKRDKRPKHVLKHLRTSSLSLYIAQCAMCNVQCAMCSVWFFCCRFLFSSFGCTIKGKRERELDTITRRIISERKRLPPDCDACRTRHFTRVMMTRWWWCSSRLCNSLCVNK